MSIQYKMVKRNDNLNPEGKKKAGYYPQVVRTKTVKTRELTRLASDETTLNAFEVEASIQILLDHIERELLNSHHVCLEGFGTFSLTAESRYVENPDEIRAESIKVKRVVFKPSKVLMDRIKTAKFVRASGLWK